MSATGIIFDEPMAAYHASPAFGVHDLDDLNPHPILFQRKHVLKTVTDEKDSSALAFGRYFHALALEGEEAAAARFVEAPACDRRTSAGKAIFAAFQQEAAGREIITAEDTKQAWRMVEAIREKPSLVALLDPAKGKPEVTFRAQMKHFQLQCRVDWFVADYPAGPLDVNLKTIDRLADFDRHFINYGYYRGAAFYKAVMAKVLGLDFRQLCSVFLVVEKNEPFQAVIREPDAQAMQIGWQEIERDILKLRACFEANSWPGESDEPKPVSLPEWKLKSAAA
jgi:hypothetical protein